MDGDNKNILLEIFVGLFCPCHIPDTGPTGLKKKKMERMEVDFGMALLALSRECLHNYVLFF